MKQRLTSDPNLSDMCKHGSLICLSCSLCQEIDGASCTATATPAAERRAQTRPNLALLRLPCQAPLATLHNPRPLGLKCQKLAVGFTVHVRGDALVSGM